jgi:hypothetical protein
LSAVDRLQDEKKGQKPTSDEIKKKNLIAFLKI